MNIIFLQFCPFIQIFLQFSSVYVSYKHFIKLIPKHFMGFFAIVNISLSSYSFLVHKNTIDFHVLNLYPMVFLWRREWQPTPIFLPGKFHGQSSLEGYSLWHPKELDWRRKWQPTPVFLPGESHGQRSLAGYSLWGHKSRTQLSD